jgi:hypothetical protein
LAVGVVGQLEVARRANRQCVISENQIGRVRDQPF